MDISDDIKKELELEKLKIYTNEKVELLDIHEVLSMS